MAIETKRPACSHKELAMAYFPDQAPSSASRRLTAWITRDEELMNALQPTGYFRGQRIYTPRQLEVLFEHLGEP
ncbi:MAG: DUF4248 domain-containing protein [Tannerellaceae bacterium]|jgi:hypothetical protein|nr:DUF4248 domain-containing protein [Tannerellaceae bacterium]